MTLFDAVRKAMLVGFGVQEKVNEFVNELVSKGELNKSEGAKLVNEWSEKAEKTTEEINKTVNEIVGGAVTKLNLVTKTDLDKLRLEVQSLSTRVKELEDAEKTDSSESSSSELSEPSK